MSDIKNVVYCSNFGGSSVKPEEVMSFVYVIEDLFIANTHKK
jgi:hypothetical protein